MKENFIEGFLTTLSIGAGVVFLAYVVAPFFW